MSIFGLIPNANISETWEWKTDVLRTINGTESRFSLRPRPRVSLTASFGPLTQEQLREYQDAALTNIQGVLYIPLWQYASQLTQSSSAGVSRVYFDPVRVPVADGGRIFLINPRQRLVETHEVTTTEADGATLATTIANDVGTGWVVCLGMRGYIPDNDSTFDIFQITGTYEVSFVSTEEPAVQRQNAASAVATHNSLPVLERKILAGSATSLGFNKEILDYGGTRFLRSAELTTILSGRRVCLMDRVLSTTDMDYWREFLDTVKGAWKPFYISTYMQDLTASGTPSTTITFNEDTPESDNETFSNIEIEIDDGTVTRHTLSNKSGSTYDISPSFAGGTITRISYLFKVRMSDNIGFEHGNLRSSVSFEITTTESG